MSLVCVMMNTSHIKALSNKESNQLNEDEQTYYELSSKVEKYQDAKKSGQFLLFLTAMYRFFMR